MCREKQRHLGVPQPPRPPQVQQLLAPLHRNLLEALVRLQRLERRIHHVVRVAIAVALGRGVRDAGVLQDLAHERVAHEPVVRLHRPQLDLARVVPPGQIVAQSRIEVPIDVEDVALAVLAGLFDGVVGAEGLADAEAGGAGAVPADDEGAVADGRAAPLDLLDAIDLDGALSPGDRTEAGKWQTKTYM